MLQIEVHLVVLCKVFTACVFMWNLVSVCVRFWVIMLVMFSF